MGNVVSIEELEQLKEIMEDEFDMLISLFVEDSAKLVNDIKNTYQAKDFEALRIAAHTLKGSSANMCAVGLADVCKDIEDKAKDSIEGGLDELVNDVASVHSEVVEVLQNL